METTYVEVMFQIIESFLKKLQIDGDTHVVNPPYGKFVPKSKRCNINKPEEHNNENNKEGTNVGEKNLDIIDKEY